MLCSQAQELPWRRLKKKILNAWGNIHYSERLSSLPKENTRTITYEGRGNSSHANKCKQSKFVSSIVMFSALVITEVANCCFFYEKNRKLAVFYESMIFLLPRCENTTSHLLSLWKHRPSKLNLAC